MDIFAQHLFFEPVVVHNGPETRAIFSTASEKDQPNFEFSAQKLVVRVQRDSLLNAGMVVQRTKTGERFLLAEHTLTPTYKVFRTLKVTRLVAWTRQVTSVDALTGEVRVNSITPQAMGNIWVLWDMIRREAPDFGFQIAEEKNLVATGEDVRLDDMLDGQEVKRVNRALGVNIIQVQ